MNFVKRATPSVRRRTRTEIGSGKRRAGGCCGGGELVSAPLHSSTWPRPRDLGADKGSSLRLCSVPGRAAPAGTRNTLLLSGALSYRAGDHAPRPSITRDAGRYVLTRNSCWSNNRLRNVRSIRRDDTTTPTALCEASTKETFRFFFYINQT